MNLRCLPHTFHGKNGLAVELHHLPSDGGAQLIDMYLAFRPRNSFQGLPPLKDEVCACAGCRICSARASMLRPVPPPRPSSATVRFSPSTGRSARCWSWSGLGFQNLGIGTELVRSCIDVADELGYERIWLPVDATNVRARHVYRKCGFEYVSNGLGRELDMACEVRRHRRPPAGNAKSPVAHVPPPYFHFPDALSPLPLAERPG